MSDNNSDGTVATAALVISIVALITTVLQVLQQYLASADGYRRCAASVMGLWARNTTRKLNWRELRFEVVFEAPVIFTAPPGNKKGPVPNSPILEVDGSNNSYEQTSTMKPGDNKVSNVHTADDERASWVTLLGAFQRNEHDSREWEAKWSYSPRGFIYDPPKHSICYMMQKKKRSWDFMPSNIIKPFATTTLCHIVEIMAMLGLYWKQFDIEKGIRAEGNGYMLTSTNVHGLGIVTTFSMTGPQTPKFEENRVIPTKAIKELAFGSVDCILEKKLEVAKEDLPHTLSALGLRKVDVEELKSLDKRDRPYLFSLTFELIAMVAKPFRIRGSNLSMIPNPCEDRWRPQINMLAGLRAFRKRFDALYNEIEQAQRTDILVLIHRQFAEDRFGESLLNGRIDIDVREAAHTALDEVGVQIAQHVRPQDLRVVLVAHLHTSLASSDALEAALINDDVEASKEERLMKHYFESMGKVATDPQTAIALTAASTGLNETHRRAIWLALIFRMWCWFLLHDFDPSDRMIVPSQFLGSRMPMFIV